MNIPFGGLWDEVMGSPDIIGGSESIGFGSVLVLMLVIWLISAVVSLTVTLLAYLIYALGTYRLAKKLGVERAWLAWIPCAQYFTLGKVAEKCDERRGLAVKPWGLIMLLVSVGAVVLVTVLMGLGTLISMLLAPLGMLFSMLASLISWAPFVIMSICCWKIYREFYPETVNVVLFIISIVFSVQIIVTLIASFRQPNPAENAYIENVEYSLYD